MSQTDKTTPHQHAIDINALMAEVKTLPEKDRPRRDRKTQMARSLVEPILVMRKKGMTYKDISAFLRDRKINISDSTLRLAVSQVEKEERARRRAQRQAERMAEKAKQEIVAQMTDADRLLNEPAIVRMAKG